MSRRSSRDEDAHEDVPDSPVWWRGFSRDATGWEMLRVLDPVGSARTEADRLALNAPVAVTSVASFLLVGWGLVALGSLSLPRAGYGLAALLGGVGLYRISLVFTRGRRWALPVVALVPPALAYAVYRTFAPAFPLRGPADLLVWLLVVGLAAADLSLLFAPVHDSWEGEGAG